MSLPCIEAYVHVPPADNIAQTIITRELVHTEKNITRMLEWTSHFAIQKGRDIKRFRDAVSHILCDLRLVKTELLAAKTTISTVLYATHRATAHQTFARARRDAAVLLADVEARDAAECADRPDFLEPLSLSRRPPMLPHTRTFATPGL